MLPMLPVRLRLGTLLAADATTLAPATDENLVALITSPFSPDENLVAADLTYAAGNGLDPISCATGAQEVAIDPITGEQLITIVPAAGPGFRWQSTGTVSLPINCYGVALLNNDSTILLAVLQFVNPITIDDDGQQINANPLTFAFVQQPMF